MRDYLYSIKKFILTLLSALLLVLAFPPFDLWILAFFAFVPLFYVIKQSTPRETFFFSYFAGVIFYALTLYWLTYVTVFGCVFLVFFYAVYWVLFAFCVHSIVHTYERLHLKHIFIIAAFWVAVEMIRAYLPVFGFGWGRLAYSQCNNTLFIQLANIFGAAGVSFCVMVINVIGFMLFLAIRKEHAMSHIVKICILLFVFVASIYGYGLYCFSDTSVADEVRVGVIQGNIPQAQKWDPEFKETIIDTYVKLIEFASYDKPEILILPEACYPGNYLYEYRGSKLEKVIKENAIPVLLGAIRFKTFGEEYNSAFFMAGDGGLIEYYDKIKLVPFGEYIPLKPLFDGLGLTKVAYSLGVSDFSCGTRNTLFHLERDKKKTVSFATLICFEDVFPLLARTFCMKGAKFLVVITNDAWFGNTSAPFQHMQASIFRAVENRCPVVRSANTGVSGFISARGEILNTVKDNYGREIFVIGGVSRTIALTSGKQTLYQQYGYCFDLICFVLSVIYMLTHLFTRYYAPKQHV